MCGIVGQWTPHQIADEDLESVQAAASLMTRRGPDDAGFWNDGKRCAFGFRRLAILDLTPAGHQPMLTADGRHAIVFNGEVYNFAEIRSELVARGVRFRSTGDTEVVLNALACWGRAALDRFNGMFALAFYDCVSGRLLLARDHAGIKPLYYLQTSAGMVFGSQFNQVISHPWGREQRISQEGLALYLRLGYVPAPFGLAEGTHMLEAGCWLEADPCTGVTKGRYFTFPVGDTASLWGRDALDAVDDAVTASVRDQLVSDVPLGVFLSGGVDSPLVAASIPREACPAIPAFTIGVPGSVLDESADAAAYAEELNLRHRISPFNDGEAMTMVDEVMKACSEPLADASIFPTLRVSEIARNEVKVALSGDGGDELFWGYAERFASVLHIAETFGSSHLARSARYFIGRLSGNGVSYNVRRRSIGSWYRAKHSRMKEEQLAKLFDTAPGWPQSFDAFDYSGSSRGETAHWLRWNEFVTHLSMVLLKVDRASMHHSLEVRVPLLDRRVIEAAARVRWEECLRIDIPLGKLPLRNVLARRCRHQSIPKRGFDIPMPQWLRGPLRPLVEDELASRTDILGVPLRKAALRKFVSRHMTGQANHTAAIWLLLHLALWETRHRKPAPQAIHSAMPVARALLS
jgi:asparagine synthase (glutamine-hydrolysing)